MVDVQNMFLFLRLRWKRTSSVVTKNALKKSLSSFSPSFVRSFFPSFFFLLSDHDYVTFGSLFLHICLSSETFVLPTESG